MKCPRCDANISDNVKRCAFCGQDLSVVHYTRRVSNAHYNLGLEKAKVRDLSGAILTLQKSLEYDKNNTNARNLLGLVYYEMGEIVMALSQWILSKYLQPEDNIADYYMETIRKNQTKLDALNQTIRKYNAALTAAKAGSIDLALIQLKKVVTTNPQFVRAQQLLALLYIESGDVPRAAKCLRQARKIDFNNTTTLRYMQEIGDKAMTTDRRGSAAVRKNTVKKNTVKKKDPLENVTPVGPYEEDKSSLMPVVTAIIGIVVGIIVSFVLIRPTLSKTRLGSTGSDSQIEAQKTQISSLEEQRDSLSTEVEELKKQIQDGDTEAQNKLKKYEKLIVGAESYIEGDKVQAAVDVGGCTKDDFDSDEAKTLYTKISYLSADQIKALNDQAYSEMNNSSYETALSTYKKVLAVDDDNQEAMLWLGRCYQRLGKNKKAKKWYDKAIVVDESTSQAAQARTFLEEVNQYLGIDNDTAKATDTPQTTDNTRTADDTQATDVPQTTE